MPVPTNITQLDANAANNSPPGTESAKGNVDNYLRAAFGFIKQNYDSITSLKTFVNTLLGTDSSNKAAARATLGVPSLLELGLGNVLINSNFRENQRAVSGTVTLAAGAYGHDRWKAGASGCTYTFSTSAGITTVNITAGTLQQVIEGEQLFSGTHILCWTGTAQGRIAAGAYGATGVTGTVTGGSNLTVEFGVGTLARPHLRPGSSVLAWTPYQGIYGGEKQACQRYYQSITGINVFGYAVGGTAVITSVQFKVSMRASPTISITGNGTQTNSSGTAVYGQTSEGFGFGVVASATGMVGTTSAQATASVEL